MKSLESTGTCKTMEKLSKEYKQQAQVNAQQIHNKPTISSITAIRNDYLFMSVHAIQDHVLGFNCTFCSIPHFMLPVASIMDQLSYALGMFNHQISKIVIACSKVSIA